MPDTESSYQIWQVPGRPVSVHFRRSVMNWIARQVQAAFEPAGGGAETGGILAGSKTLAGGNPVIVVESAEPIECEHRDGVAFSLSEADREKLAAQMVRLKAEGLVIVGYYRSHTRDETPGEQLTLSADDMALLAKWAPTGTSAFLLVRPLATSKQVADLFFWHEGRITRETSFIPFPFGTEVTAPPMEQTTSNTIVPVISETPRQTTVPVLRPDWTTGYAWLWATAILILAAAIGYSVARARMPAPITTRASAVAPLNLAAERVNERLVLKWNASVPGLKNADHAGLLIHDGARETRYTLDRSQLLGGTITYEPMTSDVTFLLEAAGEGRSFRESLTVIDPSR
jgi:hypothetical protein